MADLHDLITVTPSSTRLFEVLALDDLDGVLIYAAPIDGLGPAQWYSLAYVTVISTVDALKDFIETHSIDTKIPAALAEAAEREVRNLNNYGN